LDFSLPEDAQMIVDMAGQFAERHLKDAMRAHEGEASVPAAVHAAFADSGLGMLGALEVDPEMPVSWAARCKAVQRLAQADGAATLALWTTAWLPHVAASLGLTEPTALGYLHLVTDIDAMEWPVPCIPSGGQRHILVLDDGGKWGVAEVDITPIRTLGLSAASPVQCTLIRWVSTGDAGAAEAARARAITRLWGATILAGISRAALDYAAAYVQDRVAFGKPLAHHQGVAFMVADMAMRTEGIDLLTARSAWAMEEGDTQAGTDAWIEAIEASLWVTNHAVQLLGGHGYTSEHPVEKWMRDARALTLLWGGIDMAERDARAEWET
jgi:alkylation response protein AidB-like acyl-CoA dehydrogenase